MRKPITRSIKAHMNYNCICTKSLSFNQFVNKANIIHNNRYIYHKDKYINSISFTIITCPIHGDFKQKACCHLSGDGCPKCNQSSLEKDVEKLLFSNNINYVYQASKKKFEWLQRLKIDFYLPDYNIAIECHGLQHFKPNEWFGGKNGFEKTKERDAKKYSLCKEHNIKILYFTNQKQIKDYSLGKLIYNTDDLLKEIQSYANNK